MKTCLGCKYARWKHTKNGSLHPSGDGMCSYLYELPPLPNAMSWYSDLRMGYPWINRRKVWDKECSCKEVGEYHE
jgi:hypothetical protein